MKTGNHGETVRGFVSDLRGAGYAVLPMPRQVELGEGTVRPDADWGLGLADVDKEDIAVRTLSARLAAEHGIVLGDGNSRPSLKLAIRPQTVDTGTGDARDEQAYLIEIASDAVSVTGNAAAGLFYGVQTLLQLLEGNGIERNVLPICRIVDWPRFELRSLHWDTKHHRDTLDALRRYIDWSARFKINGILFELEDKFEYPSHPIIGAPGAFTTEELQGLVDHALERHIQLIPNVQSPAHMSYVLKHEEFAHLRCDGSNYQSCMDDPEVRRLLFDMYDDVCNATQGVKYFHLSTDEVYYAGICEKYRKPYSPGNRSLTLVDFVNAAYEHLSGKGRLVIIWLEYPLLTEHVKQLPPDLLNGIGLRKPDQTREENEHGIRQFAYCPIQGSEMTFPNYFAFTDAYGQQNAGHLADVFRTIQEDTVAGGNPIGTICSAWDDSGLHDETFWLGWSAMAQGAWTQDAVEPEETIASFMDVYYGREATGMAEVYHTLQSQARFMEYALEKLPSKARGPSYGHPCWKGSMERTDRTMIPPAMPSTPNDTAVTMVPAFTKRYESVLTEAPERLAENDRLLARLQENLLRARRNRYNLEVFLSIGRYLRHFIEMILAIAESEQQLHEAAMAGKGDDERRAMHCMVAARQRIQAVIDGRSAMHRKLTTVWERSRLPKGMAKGGREFVHVMDDVKDHLADRRPDLSYLISPHESLALEQWLEQLDDVIDRYGKAVGLAAAKKDAVPVDEG